MSIFRWIVLSAHSIQICVALTLTPVASRELNPEAPADSILASVRDDLDAIGIDTVQGKALPNAGHRPRLSNILGFGRTGTEGYKKWSNFSWSSWSWAFRDGVAGAVIAMRKPWWKQMIPRPDDQVPPRVSEELRRCNADNIETEQKICDFVKDWISTAKKDRVFVAFTRRDRDTAKRVADILERQGYTVFIYLRAGEQDPWATPDLVGSFFADAGSRYVIDTNDSRGSGGVAVEASCEQILLPPPRTKVGEWYRSIQKLFGTGEK